MKERPIILRGEEVRAILEGRKSQERRVVNPQPDGEPGKLSDWSRGIARTCGDTRPDEEKLAKHTEGLRGRIFPFVRPSDSRLYSPRCPYGAPGDRLCVKETWADVNTDSGPAIAYRHGDRGGMDLHFCEDDAFPVEYERYPGCLFSMWCGDLARKSPGHRWRPSTNMPRWASRLTLEIKAVRVERLQEISEEDALAEGVKASDATMMFQAIREGKIRSVPELQNTARGAYAVLWDSINAKRGYGWDANPWVWVIEFEGVD